MEEDLDEYDRVMEITESKLNGPQTDMRKSVLLRETYKKLEINLAYHRMRRVLAMLNDTSISSASTSDPSL
ncbi:hypothetical protein TNCV_1945921 [Trichonephila clavipes]|uniref:Uncharacterized protein n=1 Tax=Trichonephila clavipes TaxID=2585209 RepID=A0A8X6SJ00_TRICX|nr:hypothetical protein TNCV_1945921 [Trichonephila clavipes]